MDGDPPDGAEEKMIKDYLEGINGVGIIEVQEVSQLVSATLPAPPSEDEIRPTVPSPPPNHTASAVWQPEHPTKTRKRKRR
jgi:hypothetical protein